MNILPLSQINRIKNMIKDDTDPLVEEYMTMKATVIK